MGDESKPARYRRAVLQLGSDHGVGDRSGLNGQRHNHQRGGRDQHHQPARSHARQRGALAVCPPLPDGPAGPDHLVGTRRTVSRHFSPSSTVW